MRSTLAAILVLALAGASALAQTNMPPKAPMNGQANGQMGGAMQPAPMAMPMTMQPPPVPAARLAKAVAFLTVSGTRDLIGQYIQRVTPMAIMMAQRQLKQNDAAAQKDAASAVSAELKTSMTEILDNTARVYAGHFSDAELDSLIGFYKTPAGKKYVGLRQELQKESSLVVRSWAMQMNMVTIKGVVQKVAQAHPGSLVVPPTQPAPQPPAKPGAPPK